MDQAVEEIVHSLKSTIIPEFVDKLSKKYIDIISEKFNISKDELHNCTKPLINSLISSEFSIEKKQISKLKIQVDINGSNQDDVSLMGREQLRTLCTKYGLPKKRSNDDNRKLIRDYQKKNNISSIVSTPADIDEITTPSLPITTPTETLAYEGHSGQHDEDSDEDNESDELSKQRNLIIKHTSRGSETDELEEENYSENEEEDN